MTVLERAARWLYDDLDQPPLPSGREAVVFAVLGLAILLLSSLVEVRV